MLQVRRSQGGVPAAADQVLLGDTMGELVMLYACADVAFVGGSLVPNGGHNYLEPAALGLPVLSGPHRFNFTEISDLLQGAGALQLVGDAQSLAEAVEALLQDPRLRQQAGESGRAVVEANQGALELLLQGIEQRL